MVAMHGRTHFLERFWIDVTSGRYVRTTIDLMLSDPAVPRCYPLLNEEYNGPCEVKNPMLYHRDGMSQWWAMVDVE